ncbi:hypothetical protein DAPPUDRAFT_242777 [Daphnia pulex]|uniref:Uncharacterized protein n=1 Tax=Daphnia pulex TaxID=6669 RepID=E9GHE0_DAPPU|nr:hypothetical protein DAPPUDRAFT_242777 [Daphnia pulex]|eukprot:EFX81177.1 hypothetical protein DAPPUDRAFT_242777 [Daphnia pulex]
MDIITECGSVTFEAATEEIRKIKDGLDSPAGSLTSLDDGNLGENTSFAASTPLSNFSPVNKVHSGNRPFPSKPSVAKKHGVHPSPSPRSLNRSRSSNIGGSKMPRTSSDVLSCIVSMSPLSEVAGGSSQVADGKNKTNSLSVRDAMWKLKPTDARLKRPSSYPTRPVVAGIRKTGSSRSVEARSQSTLNLNVASSSKEINHIITPAVASTSKAKHDTETLVVAMVDGASMSTRHAEASTADISADKYVLRQEMLKQTLATNALLKDLIPPKRLITKVPQTYLEQFTTTVENTLSLPLTQIDDVTVLNIALLDMQLSVSLSTVQIDKLRLLTTENIIAKSLLANFCVTESAIRCSGRGVVKIFGPE